MCLFSQWYVRYFQCKHQWTYPRQADGSYRKICQHCQREKKWIHE